MPIKTTLKSRQVKSADQTTPTGGDQTELLPAVANRRSSSQNERSTDSTPRPKKVCQFCTNHIEPHYWDIIILRRYLNDRGRIVTRARQGTCAKHQRHLSKEIKRARHLALLPFTVRI